MIRRRRRDYGFRINRCVTCMELSADPVSATLLVGCQSTHVTDPVCPGSACTVPPLPTAEFVHSLTPHRHIGL